jgi:hypothetical protein
MVQLYVNITHHLEKINTVYPANIKSEFNAILLHISILLHLFHILGQTFECRSFIHGTSGNNLNLDRNRSCRKTFCSHAMLINPKPVESKKTVLISGNNLII